MTGEARDKHPFERLQYDRLWQTTAWFDIFDQEARLTVRTDGARPERWQRLLFDEFVRRQGELKPMVYSAIMEYYRSIVDDYRDQFSPEFLHLAPHVSSAEEMRRLIRPEAAYIADLGEDDEEIGLLFQCTWDDSHGLGVRLERWRVDEVGPQDVCL